MAFDLKLVNGYGTGALGDVSDPTGQINSYAYVSSFNATTVQITTYAEGAYEKFDVGNEIMLHVSASNGVSTEAVYNGKYMFCHITGKTAAATGFTLGIDKDFTQIIPAAEVSKYSVQAITSANFKSLTLSPTAAVKPPAYDITKKFGGILVIKCTGNINFNGGTIALTDAGIPIANKEYRTIMNQEQDGKYDLQQYSGWENSLTADRFLLNSGDGAVAIFANGYTQNSPSSRIGGSIAGKQYVRGSLVNGGATILGVFGTMQGFDPSIICKRRSSDNGQGLGRCYIASNTKLRNDEALYAYDVISDPMRVMKSFNVKGFGDASLGNISNPTRPLNNYAKVIGISDDGKTIGYSNKTTTGLAPIQRGALIMFHVSKHTDNTDMQSLGKLIITKVISDDGNNLVLQDSVCSIFTPVKLSKYNCQVVSVAQANDLTIGNNYNGTTAWNDSVKTGGIFAAIVAGQTTLDNGQINVAGKGGGTPYKNAGLAFIGNAQDCDILPLGQGNGSVFLMTKKLSMNKSSRIGGEYSGVPTGGSGYYGYNSTTNKRGGVLGACDWRRSPSGLSNDYDYQKSNWSDDIAGNPEGGVSNQISFYENGQNGRQDAYTPGNQGAHVLVIADSITGFNLYSVATGGYGAWDPWLSGVGGAESFAGGAGYGGSSNAYPWGDTPYYERKGGGYNGGGLGYSYEQSHSGGGSSGWAFFYVNHTDTVDNTGVLV